MRNPKKEVAKPQTCGNLRNELHESASAAAIRIFLANVKTANRHTDRWLSKNELNIDEENIQQDSLKIGEIVRERVASSGFRLRLAATAAKARQMLVNVTERKYTPRAERVSSLPKLGSTTTRQTRVAKSRETVHIYRNIGMAEEKKWVYAAELFGGFMWWWILWHFWHDFGHIIGEFPYQEPSDWTDEELGIPPDDYPEPAIRTL
ncbi:NADH dehydrogenase [ubiquinone] 1 beta subcomplex subunit 2, mitochondrial [Trachymyrmex cornetzi]|uniref:NADH dehydrogenase [ubiquinone] 1 beta subcomplex subunit 2, mitochondrial n=1 Tax=Trachymyrmex cornetzi TaxID=471704 RepID=A0A195DN19_9HYME|nr:NADH dehydrogenase [ubiquinone] 1 beta subcomplex subunit 2, mitochondrial [Trachymyrmex cornetzi]